MIPTHKCTPYCDPEEGIHCLPNMWTDGKTLDDFQYKYESDSRITFKVIKIQKERDITLPIMLKSLDNRWIEIKDQKHYRLSYVGERL